MVKVKVLLLDWLPFLIDAGTNPVKTKLQRIHSFKMRDGADDAFEVDDCFVKEKAEEVAMTLAKVGVRRRSNIWWSDTNCTSDFSCTHLFFPILVQ